MDFIRELLLKIERGEREFDTISKTEAEDLESESGISEVESARLDNHLFLLEDAN